MLALTVWPEWVYAMLHLGKPGENRSWTPEPRLRPGDRLLIHAGKHLGGRPGRPADYEAFAALEGMAGPALTLDHTFGLMLNCPKSALVLEVTYLGADREQRTPWDVPGLWHWRLGDMVALDPPIPMSGRQGLWGVERHVARHIAALSVSR